MLLASISLQTYFNVPCTLVLATSHTIVLAIKFVLHHAVLGCYDGGKGGENNCVAL